MKKTKKQNKKQTKLQRAINWKKHHKRAFVALVILLLFLIFWLIWHKPMADMFDSIFGTSKPVASQKSDRGLTIGELPTIEDDGQPSNGNGLTGTSTNGQTRTTTGTTGSTSTTTTNNTTNNTTNSGSGGGSGSGGSTGAGVQVTLPGIYGSILSGQSEDQIVNLGIGEPSCLVTVALLGEQKVCTWTQGGDSVIVTLLNDQVVAKTKLGF